MEDDKLDPSDIDSEDFDPFTLPEGASGFLGAYLALEQLVLNGYEFIDLSLILREEFGEELTEKVLTEAKERGII